MRASRGETPPMRCDTSLSQVLVGWPVVGESSSALVGVACCVGVARKPWDGRVQFERAEGCVAGILVELRRKQKYTNDTMKGRVREGGLCVRAGWSCLLCHCCAPTEC